MKDYKRLTERDEFGNADIIGVGSEILASALDFDELNKLTFALNQFAKLEDKIESGELCEREEVRKETAKEILLLLGKGFDETARKDFKDLQWYKQFCRELELRYGIELFGKTEQVENFDKLGGENND